MFCKTLRKPFAFKQQKKGGVIRFDRVEREQERRLKI